MLDEIKAEIPKRILLVEGEHQRRLHRINIAVKGLGYCAALIGCAGAVIALRSLNIDDCIVAFVTLVWVTNIVAEELMPDQPLELFRLSSEWARDKALRERSVEIFLRQTQLRDTKSLH
jgi:hypothetical protein